MKKNLNFKLKRIILKSYLYLIPVTLFLTFTACSNPASSSDPAGSFGRVFGQVSAANNSTGAPSLPSGITKYVPSCPVGLNQDGNQKYSATTDSNGKYDFPSVKPGSYNIKVTLNYNELNERHIPSDITNVEKQKIGSTQSQGTLDAQYWTDNYTKGSSGNVVVEYPITVPANGELEFSFIVVGY